MATTGVTNPKINTAWFKRRMDTLGLSVRSAAPKINMDPTQLSRTLKGQGLFGDQRLPDLARILQIPFRELFDQLGLDTTGVPLDGPRAAPALPANDAVPIQRVAEPATARYEVSTIPLIGSVDADGRVHRSPVGTQVPRPSAEVVGAVRVHALGSPFDGACLHFANNARTAECLGQTCLIDTAEGLIVGVLRPGTQPALYDVANVFGAATRRENLAVKTVSPVRWMRLS